MNEIATIQEAQPFRQSTDAAHLCGAIVKQTAKNIQGRRYVTVEGWQAIAIAHGCTASADHVERVDDEGMGGFRCTGIVRRMSDGAEISRAEGFLGDDEAMWNKRPVYARRAMVQTRAISRACRSAFAHVVVMIDAGLSTTPAEEVPHEGFDSSTGEVIDAQPTHSGPAPRTKLDGPHQSKTALKNAIHAVTNKINTAATVDDIDAALKEAKATIRQAERDWPELLNGDPAIPEDTGLKGCVAQKRESLADDGQVSMLIQSMKQCDTKPSLENWFISNEAIIDELDGADARRFQLARDMHESAINLMDAASA